MDIDFAALAAPIAAKDLEWRLQQAGEKNNKIWALCVPYVTNRAIMDRLDEVVGPAGWKNDFRAAPDGGVLCGISIRIDGEWVAKWDGAENTDIEGVKGGLSASMKRAAVQWGIGRFLYSLDESFAIVSENGKLRGKTKDGKSFRWDPPQLPAWARAPAPAAKKAPAKAEIEPMTEEQVIQIQALKFSPAVTDEERTKIERQLGDGMNKVEAGKYLTWLSKKIDQREDAAGLQGGEVAS